MRYWPTQLANYAFSPREVEAVTGVPRATQRQWLVRYLDFRQQQFIHSDDADSSTWSWEGVQMIALFAQSLRELRDGNAARRVLMLDQKPNVVRDELGIYHSDQRRDASDGNDLLIVGALGEDGGRGFSTSGSADLGKAVKYFDGIGGVYIVNFSAFQRGLYDKVNNLVDLENGPGADRSSLVG